MKILHVIRDLSPETGGPVSAIRGLAEKQRQSGHDVCIVTTDYGSKNGSEEDQIMCHCTFSLWRYAPSLKAVLGRKIAWCDVVHIHMIWDYSTLVATRLATKLCKPFLLRPCGNLDAWSISQSVLKKKIYLALFSKDIFSDGCTLHFTTQAEKNKSVYPQHLDSVVIENGIADMTFSEDNRADDFLDRFPELQGKEIILFLGRVHPKKQPDIAVKAFTRIASEFPNSCLVMAGPCEFSYQEELAKLADNLGVRERILFTGMLQGKALYGAYRAAKVFLLPSLQENFGIAVAEAMANRCPVIVSEHVDINDYIQKGDAGLVCEASVDAFASAIHRVMAMPKLGETMGKGGRKVAEQYFRWDIAVAHLDDVYRSMIADQ